MNFKRINKVLLLLGIFDKIGLKKNSKKMNSKQEYNKKKNIKQENSKPKKSKTESPSYINLNYEYKSRKQHKLEWKNCPECNKKINKVANKCPYCNYVFKKDTKEFKLKTNPINTKFAEKDGFSFNYPDYYDIGIFETNEVFKTLVGLSKKDEECEIYVMEYRISTFDKQFKRNSHLLKEALKMQGYMNVFENKKLPYCFDAIANSEIGYIKTTILYNFRYPNVIMIVGNRLPNSNYDCIEDMKIINMSV